MTLEITKDNFNSLLSDNDVVVVDFWAPWCGPCKTLGPIVDELAQERAETVIGKVNVDSNRELAQQYGIRGIPTIVFFKGGEIVKRTSGVQAKEDLGEIIDNL